MSPDNYGSQKRTPGCAVTLGRCILFALIIIVAAVLVWPFLHGSHGGRTLIAGTRLRIDALSRALEEYRAQHNVFPPDSGIGLHPDLDKPAECLVYYLSGASICLDSGSEPDYPWRHPLLDVTRLGKGRQDALVHYDFRSSSLQDEDKDAIPELVDPWDNPLLYNAGTKQDGPFNQNGAPKHNTATYDISSAGPDGKHGTEDDITNWGD